MKLKKLGSILIGSCLGLAVTAQANEVLLTSNQPTKIAFRLAHKNPDSQTIFGALQTIEISKNVTVPVSLDNYDRAGLVIVSVGGHELPPSANQFDRAEQCSMTTNKTNANGTLDFTVRAHSISCSTHGGVYG